MLLSAFAVFLCLFVVSLVGLALLHRHIESRIPSKAIDRMILAKKAAKGR